MAIEYAPMINSFNGGEISPRMHGRTDQAIYSIAAAEMLNFVPTIEGPARKRSGFGYVAAASAGATWLSAFVFSVTQAYVLEWSGLKLRFYTNGGRIETAPGVAYEVMTPYTAAQAPFVSQQQSYDRLYLAHPSHPTARITRVGAAEFAHAALVLKDGPFADQNTDETITVTAAGVLTKGGAATITASSAIFLEGHVGGNFMVEPDGFTDIKAWEASVRTDTLVVGDKRRSDAKVYEVVDLGGNQYTGTVQPTHTRGDEWDGSGQVIIGTDDDKAGVKWRYLYDRFGIGKITAIGGGGTTATIEVTRALADSLTSKASFRWRLPALSAATGWPKIVLLAFGRLIFLTDFELIASVVGDYGGAAVNMAPFTEGGLLTPDMAFRRRLAIANPVLWGVADRDAILIGTADGIYAIRKVNSGEIFSSDNIELVKQYHHGSANVFPQQTGVSTFFLQSGAKKLREAGYSLDVDRYVASEANIWQRHILKSGAKQLAFEADPDELLWAVRNDGVLALHPHVPSQQLKGFARAQHGGGEVISAVSIPNEDGSRNELWALVDGLAGLSVERQAAAWEEGETALEDAFFVDSGVSYSGPPIAELNDGINHLVGQTVKILADGALVPEQVVQAAAPKLTLPSAAGKIHVGLGFSARLTWLRPEVTDRSGRSIQGLKKRLTRVWLRLLDTVGVKIDVGNGAPVNLIDRVAGTPMNAPIPLFSGDTTERKVFGNWGRDAQGTIISDDPLPCLVVAAMPKIEVGDG